MEKWLSRQSHKLKIGSSNLSGATIREFYIALPVLIFKMNQDYIKTLSSPKWRRKRQQIFKRDHYRCTCCGNDRNLIVHHTFYFADYRDPWKYPNESLLTLCQKCHKEYHEFHENEIRKEKKIMRVVFHNKKVKTKKQINEAKILKRLKAREKAIGLTS